MHHGFSPLWILHALFEMRLTGGCLQLKLLVCWRQRELCWETDTLGWRTHQGLSTLFRSEEHTPNSPAVYTVQITGSMLSVLSHSHTLTVSRHSVNAGRKERGGVGVDVDTVKCIYLLSIYFGSYTAVCQGCLMQSLTLKRPCNWLRLMTLFGEFLYWVD